MENKLRGHLLVLNNIEKKLNSLYHEKAAELGISDTALWILHTLCDTEEIYTQYDFCEAWMYPRQTVNTAISYLVKTGYITLTVLPGTRNRKAISLTDGGKQFCREKIRPLHEAERRAYGGMTEEELATFAKLRQKQLSLIEKEFHRNHENAD